MLLYAAAGSYKLIKENGMNMPYIKRLGQLHPISVPEFAIWSSLLWEVMTYDEAKKAYSEVMATNMATIPDFDELLARLINRKLVLSGEGYTGLDALYALLSNTFVIAIRNNVCSKAIAALKLLLRGKITLRDFISCFHREKEEPAQKRVLELVTQTPLSAAELVRCFDWSITDVSTTEKLIEKIYPTEESRQITLPNETYPSGNVPIVLTAIANLYMNHKVMLERA